MKFDKSQPYTEYFSAEQLPYKYMQAGRKFRHDYTLYDAPKATQEGRVEVESQLEERILSRSGQPYGTRNKAEIARKRKTGGDKLRVVPYKDGFALAKE